MNLTAMRDLTQVDPLPRTLGEKVSAPPAPTPVRTRDPALSPRVVEGADGKLETKIPENEGARAAKLHDAYKEFSEKIWRAVFEESLRSEISRRLVDTARAEREGWSTYQAGLSIYNCPYEKISRERLAWRTGWLSAREAGPR